MLHVKLGHPKAALGRPPKLFGDGACGRAGVWLSGCSVGQRYSQIQPACVLDGFPVPMENKDETKTHLQVGCQGERGSASTRALRTRCGIEFCGPLARVRRFRCVHISCHTG